MVLSPLSSWPPVFPPRSSRWRFLVGMSVGRLAWKVQFCTLSSYMRENHSGVVSNMPLDASQKNFCVLTAMAYMHLVANVWSLRSMSAYVAWFSLMWSRQLFSLCTVNDMLPGKRDMTSMPWLRWCSSSLMDVGSFFVSDYV